MPYLPEPDDPAYPALLRLLPLVGHQEPVGVALVAEAWGDELPDMEAAWDRCEPVVMGWEEFGDVAVYGARPLDPKYLSHVALVLGYELVLTCEINGWVRIERPTYRSDLLGFVRRRGPEIGHLAPNNP